MKSFTQTFLIEQKHTASALGSGTLDVFSTPAMVALMENTAMKIVDDLDKEFTTVGTGIQVKHLRASKTGESVTCTAILTKQAVPFYEFEIRVTNAEGEIIGTANHQRAAVEINRFLRKLEKTKTNDE